MEIQVSKSRRKVMIAVDSGAAVGHQRRKLSRDPPTRPSARSRGGVQYVNANGSKMPSRGEKLVPVNIGGGDHCALKLQVTDAQRTLLSVSKVCDGGHEVVFRSDGGFIRYVETNRKIGEFQRVIGVYRMEVEVEEDATAGFSWPK